MSSKKKPSRSKRLADHSPPTFPTSWKGIPVRDALEMMGVEIIEDVDIGDEPARQFGHLRYHNLTVA